MKIMTSFYQEIRNYIKKDVDITSFVNKKFPEWYKIKYSNFGFIVVPEEWLFVYKYYFGKFNNLSAQFLNLHIRELEKYEILKLKWFCLPDYEYIWNIKINDKLFHCVKFENIRISQQKITSFKEIEIEKFASFCNKLHSDGFVHWNIHPSNFFISNRKIWIFDLTVYRKWQNEKDLSRVFSWYDFDIKFFEEFLQYYIHSYDLKTILNFCLEEQYMLYKWWYWDKSDIYENIIKLKNTNIHLNKENPQ